ncbi:MAG: sigma factor [Thermodesulfobacteriota bacterium]
MFGLGSKKELTDEEVMVRFQDSDARAFDLLLDRHNRGVLRFIMKTINVTSPEAEDMLQEVFLKVIENREKYDSSQKFTK